MADTRFLSWRRRGGTSIGAGSGGRAQLKLMVTATDDSGGEVLPIPEVNVLLQGPGDVVGLAPGAITSTFPRPGQIDVETKFNPYAELAAADLPWRYGPAGENNNSMIPWIALLVARLGPSAEIDWRGSSARLQRAVIDGAVRPSSLLGRDPQTVLGLSAHVQRTPDVPDGQELSRLLALRPLDENTRYVALVVPVFNADGSLRWAHAAGPVDVPVYYSWTFETGTAQTFESLAKELKGADQIEDFGTIGIDVGAGIVGARGALTAIHTPVESPVSPEVVQRLTNLLAFDPDAAPPPHEPGTDAEGRRYVRPPAYGNAWLADPLDEAPGGGWVDQVNRDPRHRAVAGLGLQAGVDLQDELAISAAARYGAVSAANGRLGSLVAGLRSTLSLWQRRLPTSADERIRLLGLSAARIITVRDSDPASTLTPLLERATGQGRTLPSAMFSSAGLRVLRARASRLRYSAIDPANIVTVANQVRSTVRRPDDAPDDIRAHDGVAHGDALVASLGSLIVHGTPVSNGDELVNALLSHRDFSQDVGESLDILLGTERANPVPTDLGLLDDALTRAFNPNNDPPAIRRVRATINPDETLLQPRELCADLDLPAWRYLRDHQREWLLPGAHTLQDGEVVGLASNPSFIDALLLGMNTQTLAELRWRALPVATGCTPLRRFWDRHGSTPDGNYVRDTDIAGVATWVGNVDGTDRRGLPLGDTQHAPDSSTLRRQLVLAFCTDLFRRYPSTLVYLAPPKDARWDNAELLPSTRILPVFTARISPRINLFAFNVAPETLATRWVVVEQQPPGTRFENPAASTSYSSSAMLAQKRLVQPVRVLLSGQLLSGDV